MVTKAEMHKKMIKTVLDKLPTFIQRYSVDDQELLNEFCNLVNQYEKADNKRSKIIEEYDLYTKKLLGTDLYIQTPFLWFTVDFFRKARLTLNWANFQAVSFYEYLSKYLRKNPSYNGVYELLHKQTPLSDKKWEHLQYECAKMLYPLTEEQMKIVQKKISLIKSQGIYALDRQKIKSNLSKLFPTGTKIDKLVTSLLTNLESKWNLNYHIPAFGIERFFFHIEGIKSKINNVIDFQDLENTTLCLSDVFKSRDHINDYMGILNTPTQDIKTLTRFMTKLEQQGIFKLKKLSLVKTSERKLSLNNYKIDKGWELDGLSNLKRITRLQRSGDEERKGTGSSEQKFSQKFDTEWRFTQHQLPLKIIKMFCDIPTDYEYSELPISISNVKGNDNLSKTNIGLLKQLHYKNILAIDWIPWRLVFEYSLDSYWIIAPKEEGNKINELSKIVPFSIIYSSEEETYIWLNLTSQIAQWLKEELKWKVYPVSRYSSNLSPRYNWFSEEKLRWKTPYVLLT